MMRLEPVLAEILLETQCGFHKNRSCTNMTFVARQLQEKSMEQQRLIYFAFIDLTKVYNTVNRQALWQLLERYGVPAKLLNIIKDLHIGMKGTVRLNGEYSKPFGIKNGLRQDCVIAPNLFNLFFARVIAVAVERASGLGMFRFKINGKLFDPRRPRGAAELLVRELLFADDAAIVCDNPSSLQEIMVF